MLLRDPALENSPFRQAGALNSARVVQKHPFSSSLKVRRRQLPQSARNHSTVALVPSFAVDRHPSRETQRDPRHLDAPHVDALTLDRFL